MTTTHAVVDMTGSFARQHSKRCAGRKVSKHVIERASRKRFGESLAALHGERETSRWSNIRELPARLEHAVLAS